MHPLARHVSATAAAALLACGTPRGEPDGATLRDGPSDVGASTDDPAAIDAATPDAGAPDATTGHDAGDARLTDAGDASDVALAPYAFGTLVTNLDHAADEAHGGVRVAMIELSWRLYEPTRGMFDAGYAASMRARMDSMRADGMRVTLALGTYDPPMWAFGLPNSRFVAPDGSTAGELDLVFNQAMRVEVEAYLARVDADLGVENFWAVRLTSGGDAEVLYPGGNQYWAFGPNALNGPDLPPSMARNPFPAWRPGSHSLSTAQVQQWADWYVAALDDVVDWQRRTLEGLGFRGWHEVLTPGSGTRPDGYASDVANDLASPSVTCVGAVWHRFYAMLPSRHRVVAYVSSMADLSGGDDSCQPGDAAVALTDPAADGWSATRWISRIAHEYAMPANGENPGFNAPTSLNPHYLDASDAGMMSAAFRQVTSCGFQGMYWAHSDRLWDGTVPFARYAAHIAVANGGLDTLPPFPAP